MRASDRFLFRRMMDSDAFLQLRSDVHGDVVEVSRAMDDSHRFIHESGQSWLDCELEPCHSVGVLLGDLALLDLASRTSKEPA